MQTTEERLLTSVNELLAATRCCFYSGLGLPALILTYVGIDFAASLDRTDPDQTISRKDFIAWVEKYLLPASDLKCASFDLYAARCGMVHTYTSKSKLVQEKKVKEIFYDFGLIDRENQIQRGIKDPAAALFVHFPKLFNAFKAGLDRWRADFLSNPEHKARVLKNAETLLHTFRRVR